MLKPKSSAPIEEAKLLSDRQVSIRYDVSVRTIERWSATPDLKFPPPIYILRRKYRDRAKLNQWDRLNMRRATDPAYRHPGIEKRHERKPRSIDHHRT